MINQVRNRVLTVAFLCALFVGRVATASSDSGMDFQYPELTTVPSASDRVALESVQHSAWRSFIPLQLSAAASVGMAVVAYTQTNDTVSQAISFVPMGVSGGLLVANTILEFTYHPYGGAQERLSGLPKDSTREQLLREREAEETIEAASRFAQVWKYSNIVLNFASQTVVLLKSNAIGSQGAAGVGMILSLVPLFFKPHWVDVADRQENYRKRVFAPLASATVFADKNGSLIPGVGLSMRF